MYLFIGAVAGVYLRYKIAGNDFFFSGIPLSILLVNVLGSFILGLSMSTVQKFGLNENYVLLLGVGFCGSLTTMSSFAYETVTLLDASEILVAFIGIILNVGLSILAVIAGISLVSFLSGLF